MMVEDDLVERMVGGENDWWRELMGRNVGGVDGCGEDGWRRGWLVEKKVGGEDNWRKE